MVEQCASFITHGTMRHTFLSQFIRLSDVNLSYLNMFCSNMFSRHIKHRLFILVVLFVVVYLVIKMHLLLVFDIFH